MDSHTHSLTSLTHLQPKKLGRRRGTRPNYGLALNGGDEEEEEGVGEDGERKGYSYPPEFPVGKTVFLENDRRRSGWLPAVVSSLFCTSLSRHL